MHAEQNSAIDRSPTTARREAPRHYLVSQSFSKASQPKAIRLPARHKYYGLRLWRLNNQPASQFLTYSRSSKFAIAASGEAFRKSATAITTPLDNRKAFRWHARYTPQDVEDADHDHLLILTAC